MKLRISNEKQLTVAEDGERRQNCGETSWKKSRLTLKSCCGFRFSMRRRKCV